MTDLVRIPIAYEILDAGNRLLDNLRFAPVGGVAEWLMAADCKSAL